MLLPRLKSVLAVEVNVFISDPENEPAPAAFLSPLHEACASLRTVMIHYHYNRSCHEVRLWRWEPTGWTRDQAHEHGSLWDASVKRAMKDAVRELRLRTE
jgi:hypothetical protein